MNIACCGRVDGPYATDPLPGSVQRPCAGCGAPCWFHGPSSPVEPGEAVEVRCPDCLPPGLGVMRVALPQVEVLRAHGIGDREIARTLALAALAYGNPTAIPPLLDEIARNPVGPTACHYRELLAELFVALAGFGR